MKIVTRRFSAALRLVVPIVAVLFAGPLWAEEAAKPAAGESETELAKKTKDDSFNLYYYDITVTNGVIHQIVQRVTQAAC